MILGHVCSLPDRPKIYISQDGKLKYKAWSHLKFTVYSQIEELKVQVRVEFRGGRVCFLGFSLCGGGITACPVLVGETKAKLQKHLTLCNML